MECHPGYAILLDEEGRFLKAANLRYEVGQTVCDPVLMRDGGTRPRKSPVRWVWRAVAAVAACCLLFFGVSSYLAYRTPYTAIYLTINPQVRMDLNREGLVVELEGLNADGTRLLEGYDCGGKDSVTVTGELVERAIALGFLSEGGFISCAIDAPEEALFRQYGMALRDALTDRLDGRMAVQVEIVAGRDAVQEGPDETPRVSPPAASPTPTAAPTAAPTPSPTPTAIPSAAGGGQTPGYEAGDYGVTIDPPAASPTVAGSDYGSAYGSGYSAYGSDYSSYGDGSTDYDPDHR